MLRAADLIGECPRTVAVVGIETAVVRTGIGLSAAVERAVPGAAATAVALLDSLAG